MIQASELRIGNWVFNIKKQHLQINIGHLVNLNSGTCNYYGIPLSPEILEKCEGVWLSPFGDYVLSVYPHKLGNGFKNLIFCGDYLYLEEGPDKLKPQERDVITLWNKDLMKQFYLHQLQNLFYVLVGSELPISF